MAAQGDHVRPIRFEGRPSGLEALVEASVSPAAGARLELAGVPGRAASAGPGEGLGPVSLQPVGPAHALARLVLPPSTPPGTYQAFLSVEGVDYPAEVRVGPEPSARFVPESLELRAAPDGEALVEVHVLNTGNVALTVDGRAEFDLSEAKGLDRALSVALRETAGGGDRRLVELLDQLAAAEAGPVQAEVREGAGDLQPGEARWVAATLRFTARLVPGRTYAGSWPLAGTTVRVRVEAVEGPPRKARARATKEAR